MKEKIRDIVYEEYGNILGYQLKRNQEQLKDVQ